MSTTSASFPEHTRFFTVSTAGHVDHGKTSLLRALTGIDPDRLKEEKERQMTTDLGFAFFEPAPDFIVGFVDVPGHGKFLKNMLAGVGGIDMALLVVAADEGPMPQTVQHVRILSLLGINKAVVALTKIDVVNDSEHIALVEDEIAELLKQHGIEILDTVPVSSTKNVGIDALKASIEKNLRSLKVRDTAGGAFLPIDRVFSKSGFGTVITGTLVRGKLAVGDQVTVAPDAGSARVRRLETHGRSVEVARAGQRVACNLVLKDNKRLVRGDVVISDDVVASKTMIVHLIDRPRLAGEKLASRVSDQPVRLYHGTAEHHGYIRWAEQLEAQTDNEHAEAIALLALEEPAMAHPQDRFVVRLSDETIFGGEIIMRDKPRWLNKTATGDIAGFVLNKEYEQAALAFIESAPHRLIKKEQLLLFLPSILAQEAAKNLIQKAQLSELSNLLMPKAVRDELAKRLVDSVHSAIKERADAGEDVEGVGMEPVRAALSPRLERGPFQTLIDEEVAAGRLLRHGDKLALPGAAPKAQPASPLHAKVLELLDHNLCLELDELATASGTNVQQIKNIMQQFSKTGQAQLINYEFAISKDNLHKAHKVLEEIWQAKRNIAPTDFREALNTTRKYAMALLQHFDDTKVTRRLQTGRVLLKSAQEKP